MGITGILLGSIKDFDGVGETMDRVHEEFRLAKCNDLIRLKARYRDKH